MEKQFGDLIELMRAQKGEAASRMVNENAALLAHVDRFFLCHTFTFYFTFRIVFWVCYLRIPKLSSFFTLDKRG